MSSPEQVVQILVAVAAVAAMIQTARNLTHTMKTTAETAALA